VLKNEGVGGVWARVTGGRGAAVGFAFGEYDFIVERRVTPFDQDEYEEHRIDETKILNWIVPDLGAGSGGHINIFRFVSMLEKRGFHSRVYMFRTRFENDSVLREYAKEHFKILDPAIELYGDRSEMRFAHGTVATSWETAYAVRDFDNTVSKLYFVQDYEPYFFAKGSKYELAKSTYGFGFRGVTAGDWLKEKLAAEHGMRAGSFGFSYDREIYKPSPRADDAKRIFFYARPNTPRRDFEIGVLAFTELAKTQPEAEIVFAGENVSKYHLPFRHRDLGVVPVERLAGIYSGCDLCLVLSNTNLSLLPLEIMASGSVVVCSRGENNTWLLSEENAIFVDYEPGEIASTLAYYLSRPEELDIIRRGGMEFAAATSWEIEGDKVRDIISTGIEEDEK
jgi:glycosyltransferase involved in cell wall biosynthesis